MIEPTQQWELFGYDMRQLGKHWLAAWRDLLWGYDSPIRERLDEVVSLRSTNDSSCYQAGKPCEGQAVGCTAMLLPDELVLCKELRLPLAAESELHAVLDMEINAYSPFSTDDTGSGWRIVARDNSHIRVMLVIVSKSASMAYLGRQFDTHDARAQEIWAEAGGVMVVISGFGEGAREGHYRKRLLYSAIMLSITAALLLLIVGLAAGFNGMELQRVEKIARQTEESAVEASRMRSSLLSANETIIAANNVIEEFPSPHLELARLTQLLGDTASLADFSINGTGIRVRGMSIDGEAAAVMQLLIDEPAYLEVTAPQAITRVGRTDMEQFFLNIRLRGRAPE
jgi:hypothetical protein